MPTEIQVKETLIELKELLEKIDFLRQHAVAVEKGLAEVKSRYEERLGEFNAEEERLEVLRFSLRVRLKGKSSDSHVASNSETIQNWIVSDLTEDTPLALPNPLLDNMPDKLEDIRRYRKQKLADHIYYFIDHNQEAVLKVINSILVSVSADVGEMLERLIWGPIWSEKSEWESLEDQFNRLCEWRQALKDRLAYWETIIQNLEHNSCYALWKEWTKGENNWNQFIGELARKQQAQNVILMHEVSVLEAELHERIEQESSNDK